MERSEININILKKNIKEKNVKIQSLNYRLNNEVNEYLLKELEEDINNEKKTLTILTKKLNEEMTNDKKTKAYYRKSLNKIRESLVEFSKVSKNNDKLRKHTLDINNIMLMMEKYLNN